MSLFSRMFEPSWRSALRRGRAALASGRWAEAWHDHRAALPESPPEEQAAIEAALDQAGAALVEMNVDAAEGALRGGDRRAAHEAAEIAAAYVRSDDDRVRVAALLERVRAARHEEAALREVTDAVLPAELELVDWALLLGAMPDAQADLYDALPARAQHAVRHARTVCDASSLELLQAVAGASLTGVIGFETGLVQLQLGRLAAAADTLLAAARTAEAWNEVRLVAAHVLGLEERWGEAEELLQQAIDADDTDVAVWAAVVRHGVLTGELDAANEAVAEALRRFPNDIRLETMRGHLLDLAGSHEGASVVYEGVIARTWQADSEARTLSFHADSAHLAALNYLRRGVRLDRAEELLAALGMALQGPPRDHAELGRAWAITRQGRSAEAAELLDRVVRRLPPEQALARAWAARIVGDAVAEATLVATLNERGQRAWRTLLKDRGLA